MNMGDLLLLFSVPVLLAYLYFGWLFYKEYSWLGRWRGIVFWPGYLKIAAEIKEMAWLFDVLFPYERKQ
jgi:hypothetical protein